MRIVHLLAVMQYFSLSVCRYTDNIDTIFYRNLTKEELKGIIKTNLSNLILTNTEVDFEFKSLPKLYKIDNAIDDKAFILKLKKIITANGCLKIEYLAKNLQTDLNKTVDFNTSLSQSIKNYITNLDKYFNSIPKQQLENDIDKEYYFLDIISSTNEKFASESQILLHNFMGSSNTTPEVYNNLVADVNEAIFKEKQENMRYICGQISVCRAFPAYSDHVADLLKEILDLPPTKFERIIIFFQGILSEKTFFFNSFIDEDIVYKIAFELDAAANNVTKAKELISDLINVLKKRHRIFRSYDKKLSKRTKAVRILLDIIDSTFAVLGENFIDLEFDSVIQHIKIWATDDNHKIHSILVDFMKVVFDTLKFYWDPEAKEEIQVLVEFFITGTSTNNIQLEDLFTHGSKFIHGESILSSIDSI